jgi:soluble calcium-activated nucleotidase 1
MKDSTAVICVIIGAFAYVLGLRYNTLHMHTLPSPPPPPLYHTSTSSDSTPTAVEPTTFYPAPSKRQMLVHSHKLLFNLPRLDFAIVTDLDKASRDPHKFLWRSHFKRGALVRTADNNNNNNNNFFEIEWSNQTVLESKFAFGNRSMELSELVRYDHLLLAMCDITGLVFKIQHKDGSIFQRWALADGDGEKAKPFKGEWATVKDGLLWLGSTGKEWTTLSGAVAHRNPEWVKSIDRNGRIENFDWGPIYQSMRTATNTSFPGYLWHEAVHFDQLHRRWIFLPRKESREMYHPDRDERKGTNLLITTAEDFSDMQISRLGPKEDDYGFSAIRKIPGTNDLFVALKVREVNGSTATKMTVFDLDGNFHIHPSFVEVDNNMKFEGLAFLDYE